MAQGSAAGFFCQSEGGGEPVVITNHHVVWGANEVTIETNNGTIEKADIVGVDPETDLAVLRARSNSGVPRPLSFGGDESLRVGDQVVAIGSPGGVFNAVSLGILSARGRVPNGTVAAHGFVDYLFVDAIVAAGSSGGPVLGIDGRVIGVNTGAVGGVAGLGIVLPSRVAIPVAEAIQRGGSVRHSFSGVRIADVAGGGRGGAVRVTSLFSTRPEQQLHVDDLIVKIDGRQLQGASDFQWREFWAEPGTRWRLDLRRGSDEVSVMLTLQALTQEAYARLPNGRSQP